MLNFKVQSDKSNTLVHSLLIIKNKGNRLSTKTLVDTGASIPVWVRGKNSFKEYFPNSILVKDTNAIIGGFGKKREIVSVYMTPIFELSDGKETIIFHNLYIAVMERDFSFDMIISFPMLNKLNFKYVSDSGLPALLIDYSKSEYFVGHKFLDVSDELVAKGIMKILEGIYIFTQEENNPYAPMTESEMLAKLEKSREQGKYQDL